MTLVLLVGILAFAIGHGFLTKSASSSTETEQIETEQTSSAAAQEVTLSWGKLNYNPDTITVSAGQPVKIIADLTRLQGCFRSFVIPDLGISTYFSSKNNILEFIPTTKGVFRFTCSMGMGKGTLIVE